MPRERLPDRRQAETVDLWHGDRRFHLTIGEYPDGRPGEVFIHGAKPGSDTDLLCDDIGVLISRLLQHGDSSAPSPQAWGSSGTARGRRLSSAPSRTCWRRRPRGRRRPEVRRHERPVPVVRKALHV